MFEQSMTVPPFSRPARSMVPVSNRGSGIGSLCTRKRATPPFG